MKKENFILYCLLLVPLLTFGCIDGDDVSAQSIERHHAGAVSAPAVPVLQMSVPCAQDADCGSQMVCDYVGPDYSSNMICVEGCRFDSQCGVEGICEIPVCDLSPCVGTCIESRWQQAIDILGFEDGDNWTATSGTATASSDAVQGEAALSVNGPGWQFVLTSVPFGPLPGVDDDVTLAIKLPVEQPNPWWYGQLQLYVEAPSLGLYNRFIGVAELTGLPTGTYVSVDFPLPPDVKALLQGDYSDLKVTIALNVPYDAAGVYLLDDLRFGDDIVPPVITAATSETPVFGTGPFETFTEDITLLGHIEEDNTIEDVTVSVDGGTPVHPVVDTDGFFNLPLSLDRDFGKVSVTYPITITAVDGGGNSSTTTIRISALSPAVPDELIVIFNKDTTDARKQILIDAFSGTMSKRLNDFTWLVVVPPGTASAAMSSIAVPSEDIRDIYPNLIIQSQLQPNDPLLYNQREYLGAIRAFSAWDIETGSDEVIVAVVDSGINYAYHIEMTAIGGECNGPEQFIDNIYLNESECCENPPCAIDIDNACIPKTDPTDTGRCPVADLNGDGCPGECGKDDDNDGAADMADPDVHRLYSNGFDDDGDGLVDEQAKIDGKLIKCEDVGPGQLKNAPADGDCDGAANDDDENGYPDDCRGWSFGRIILPKCTDTTAEPDGTCLYRSATTHPNQVRDTKSFQYNGDSHGSMVARILGEPADDCGAYAGIAHHVKILPLGNGRLFPAVDDEEAKIQVDLATTVEAYKYAGQAGAHIINSSFENGFKPFDAEFLANFPTLTSPDHIQRVTDLLNLCGTDQALHVMSAGNNGQNTDSFTAFPTHAQIDNKLVVGGSLKEDDSVWSGSNYGDQVDLAAPAENIMGISGTSFSTPMVSGAAALLMSRYPSLRGNPAVVADIIRESARRVPAWSGKSVSGGILNIYDALESAVPDEIFVNISQTALPAPQDNATNDVDLFDANGDGRLDMLEVSCSRSDVKTQPHLRINDNGGLRDETTDMLPTFKGSFCDAAEGDLDDDGRMDIVLAAYMQDGSAADNQNRILMNNGNSFDLSNTLLPSDDQFTRAVSLCDFDSDGDLDIYFGNVSSIYGDSSDVLLQNDDGIFSDISAIHLVAGEESNGIHKVICVDVDVPPLDLCDGLSDSECALCADPTVSIHGLVAAGKISSGNESECLDTREKVTPELVLAGGEGTPSMLLRQDASGVYLDVSCDLHLPLIDGTPVACVGGMLIGRQDYDVAAGDFNKDGAPDLVFVSRSGDPNPSNTLLYNNGDGTFEDVTDVKWNITPDDSREVEVGDVNNDGWDDILVIRGNPNTMNPGANSLYLNNGDGTFAFEAASGLRTDVSITTDGDLGDIDNDGDLDLILGNYGEPNLILDNSTI